MSLSVCTISIAAAYMVLQCSCQAVTPTFRKRYFRLLFFVCVEHFDELKDQTKALNYMFQTARNTFLNYCEHETVRFVYTDYILARQQEADNYEAEQQDARFLEEYLKEIVAKMPPVRRKVFVMSRYKHMTNKEIAKELGISEKTVEVHITLALRELRERLND